MNKQSNNSLSYASHGASLGIFVYIILAISKLMVGYLFKSTSLQADGLNNFSDIIASASVWIGLKIAQKPADRNHKFGHEKYEVLSSFIVALLMLIIGMQVISNGLIQIINNNASQTNILVVTVTIFSIITLFFTQSFLHKLATKTNSIGLRATAKDMRNDMLISIGTLLGSIGIHYGYPILDTIISLVVGILILSSAVEILKASSFTLSDGFNPQLLLEYEKTILEHSSVKSINNIRARMGGQQIYLDVTIGLDPNMSVAESHKVTEELEKALLINHQLRDIDVHVEPFE